MSLQIHSFAKMDRRIARAKPNSSYLSLVKVTPNRLTLILRRMDNVLDSISTLLSCVESEALMDVLAR